MAFEHSREVIDLTGDDLDGSEEREVLEIIEGDDSGDDPYFSLAHVDINLTGDKD